MQKTVTTGSSISFDQKLVGKAFAYIEQKWQDLRVENTVDDGTLIGLPHPYIVPSSEKESSFEFNEMYYWDSYFIARGLLETGHYELAEGMLENLLYLSKRFHIIPNASRFYHSGRSQPPLLTSFLREIYTKLGKDSSWLRDRVWIVEKEYGNVWMSDAHPNWRNVFNGLSRYYEVNMLDDLAEAESGWDMTTRFSGKCLSYIPVDLNSLLYKYEMDFSFFAGELDQPDREDVWKGLAEKRAETMTSFMWDHNEKFFFDYNFGVNGKSEVFSLAAYYPLWAKLATKTQAEDLVTNLNRFLQVGGLSTTQNPGVGDSLNYELPRQWAYPNGWAPLHLVTIEGLENYSFHNEAQEVARRWLQTNINYFDKYGVFREAYNTVSPMEPPQPGVYPPQLGFGWTNAIFICLAKKYMNEDELLLV